MAIAYDNSTDGGTATGPLTFSHTCSTSNDRILLVGALTTAASGDITSITYGGVAMTRLLKVLRTATNENIYLYYLNAPLTGANNVVITPATSIDVIAVASSYIGATAASVDSSNSSNVAANATYAVSTTVVRNNSWAFILWRNTGTSSTAGAGTTIRKTAAAASNSFGIGDSNGLLAAGSRTLTITSTVVDWVGIIASFGQFDSRTLSDDTVTGTDDTTALMQKRFLTLNETVTGTDTVTGRKANNPVNVDKSSVPSWVNIDKSSI